MKSAVGFALKSLFAEVGDRRQPTPNPDRGGEDSYTGEMGNLKEAVERIIP